MRQWLSHLRHKKIHMKLEIHMMKCEVKLSCFGIYLKCVQPWEYLVFGNRCPPALENCRENGLWIAMVHCNLQGWAHLRKQDFRIKRARLEISVTTNPNQRIGHLSITYPIIGLVGTAPLSTGWRNHKLVWPDIYVFSRENFHNLVSMKVDAV